MSEIVLTDQRYDTMKRVNREGNRVRWTEDKELWNQIDRWEFPVEVRGTLREDCDGITLYKMRALIDEGFDPNSLLFIICYTETNEGHAILCVRTDRGDFFLDNRYQDVMTLKKLRDIGYKFLYRSNGNMLGLWEKIK